MSDLISRKEMIRAIDSLGEDYISYYKLLMLIGGLPSAEPEQRWTPVTEALPEDTEFVLLTIRRLDKSYNQTPFISVGYISWNQSAWWCAHDGDCETHNVEVLAWMPLPEPWRGDR